MSGNPYLCCDLTLKSDKDTMEKDMKKIQYTGFNYVQVKEFCGEKVLDPYFCMGFSMLSLLTDEGFMTVHEGDTLVRDDQGEIRIER